jgi:L-Ala-D/L-Glu epimerase
MRFSLHTLTLPLQEPLRISRGNIDATTVLRIEVRDGHYVGRGECCPTGRNNESDMSETLRVWLQYFAIRRAVSARELRTQLQKTMRASAARNALDCALWDLEAKQTGVSVQQRLAGQRMLSRNGVSPLLTCVTIGLSDPRRMAQDAQERVKIFSLLKLKLGGSDGRDAERLRAVRAAAPTARLLVDVNEG